MKTEKNLNTMNVALKNNEALLKKTSSKVDRNEKVLMERIREQDAKIQ